MKLKILWLNFTNYDPISCLLRASPFSLGGVCFSFLYQKVCFHGDLEREVRC